MRFGRRVRRSSRHRRRARRPARSTRRTTASRRSAARCRSCNMMLGEVSPGGVGAGLYGMLVFALLVGVHRRADGRAHAGVPRQEDPGRRDEARRALPARRAARWCSASPARRSCSTAPTVVDPATPAPHGLSEILYAFTSAANNNGSAFGGLTGNTDWYNTTLGLAMLVGRFFLIVPVLAIAGSLARKQPVPPTAGTFPTDTPLFAGLLVGVVLIVVGLTFFPVLALGPIVEHLWHCERARPHRPSLDAGDRCAARLVDSVAQARPAPDGAQPGDVRRRGRQRAHDDPVLQDLGDRRAEQNVFAGLDRGRGSGSRCCSPTSPRRWPRGGARRRPTTLRRTRAETIAPAAAPTASIEEVSSSQLEVGDEVVVVDGRRGDPGRRRRDRGHRQRRRVGDHRRVGAGDPRVGRRPLGGHRRHARAVRPDRRAHHRAAGRDLPRPDDRARRGRRAAEDAERDRAQHPARRADDHLPARDRDAAAVRDLLGRRAAT